MGEKGKWRDPAKSESYRYKYSLDLLIIIKTLYIDKFYLDKYEQNNNIGQIGIHSLSGALNIGATYGKDVIPSKVTEQVKEEIEKIKGDMEEMEKPPTGTDEADKHEEEESSSDSTPIPGEEGEDFTEIWIEDWIRGNGLI